MPLGDSPSTNAQPICLPHKGFLGRKEYSHFEGEVRLRTFQMNQPGKNAARIRSRGHSLEKTPKDARYLRLQYRLYTQPAQNSLAHETVRRGCKPRRVGSRE